MTTCATSDRRKVEQIKACRREMILDYTILKTFLPSPSNELNIRSLTLIWDIWILKLYASCYCQPSRCTKVSKVCVSERPFAQTPRHIYGSCSPVSKMRWWVQHSTELQSGGFEGNGLSQTELKGSFTDGSRDKPLCVRRGYRSSGKKEKKREWQWQTERKKKEKGNRVPHGRITEFE